MRRVHFHVDRVEIAVRDRWGEGQAVFVSDHLGDLTVNLLNGLFVFGKIGAAPRGIGNSAKQIVTLSEDLFVLLQSVCVAFFAVAHWPTDGNTKYADVAGL